MLKHIPVILLLLLCGYWGACSNIQQSRNASTSPSSNDLQGVNYTAAFPDRDISIYLQEIQKSVLRIVATGTYETYHFEPALITLPDIHTNNPADIARNHYTTSESTAGTAIILEHSHQNSLLITCEHVVAFPDTIVAYYEAEDETADRYVESISIKRKQSNLIYSPLEFQKFDIVATNASWDLALLSAPLPDNVRALQQPLDVAPGNIERLQLGTFLYVLGYPKGYPMVTSGLASTHGNWNSRFLITDALFNPGISGGLIIASNDGYNSFEWIGMASSAAANRENILIPRPDHHYERLIRPYQDSVFVQEKSRIAYGITLGIPIHRIRSFLEENNQILKTLGFHYRGQ